MDWQKDKELLVRLRKLHTKNKPRKEFVETLRTQLEYQTNIVVHRRNKFYRPIQFGLGLASVFALLLYLFAPSVNKEALPPMSSYPTKQEFIAKPPVEVSEKQKQEQKQKQKQNQQIQLVSKPKTSLKESPSQKQTAKETEKNDVVAPKPKTKDNSKETNNSTPKEKALTYLQQLGGEDLKGYQINPALSAPARGYIFMNRMVNGIPFLADSYKVELDESGQIKQSTITKSTDTNMKFPLPQQAISKATAKQLFMKNMRLVYQGDEQPRLTYEFNFSGYIDAVSGQVREAKEEEQNQGSCKPIPIVAQGKKLIAHTPEEVVRILQQEFGIVVYGPGALEDTLSTDTYKEYSWQIEEGKIIKVETLDGQLMGFKISTPGVKERDSSTIAVHKELSGIAKGIIERYMDVHTKELLMIDVEKTSLTQTYRFRRSYQGIPIMNRSYSVTLDAKTEKVIGLNLGYGVQGTTSLPDKSKAITSDVAATIYLKERPLSLVYVMLMDKKQQIAVPHLVYQIYYHDTPRLYVDAITGEVIR
ncbi:PepSY domain-containing protein [Brevibacillus laterosporus]|uniref:PepSY domain-containing protein n=1 Tax=Brevibacillus laterosporus TaxID=1465 RepID=A0AAP8QHH2_BRELA|nr:PepSY domain-containing protein [Brevibacillus laterosporus]MCR8979548.1 PepSY domain-containing protein [Brevibacillus laterosporus]MCZ0806703.1 PepSY domain-containing protein [Brevibacillus laterosporus]MCZ0828511.1 PepSY domain-containing protein [Brevibacillus laterosporus]MCZ0852581.1 PepSY domain-containing protein [Brevibacillus laterosporus]MED1665262.1 PepSY domain-containing protein [Brevibacillus laterosporus]